MSRGGACLWTLGLSSVLVGSIAAAGEKLPSPGRPGSHAAYVTAVRAAERDAFRDALEAFDAHLRKLPNDVVAAVERCKLVGTLVESDEDRGDADEDDRERRESLFPDCLKALEQRFPRATVALIYRLETKWGDEAIRFGETLLADPRLGFIDRERAKIYEKIARAYVVKKQPELSSRAAEQAVALDPSIDLAEIIGTELLAEGRTTEAIAALSARTDGNPFGLSQRARLLGEAGSPSRALWMIGEAKKRHGYVDPSLEAKLLERVGKVEEARQKYAAMKGAWNRHVVLANLLMIDLARGNATSAVESYQALRDLGWRADPFGGYRLALARRCPGAGWRARDGLGLLGLLAAVLFCALLPGLWIVPFHYWSLFRRLRGPLVEPPSPATRWRFRHVWLASGTFLAVQLVCLDWFDYDEPASWLRQGAEKREASVSALAAYGLWSSLGLAILLGALLIRRSDLRLFGPGSWSVGKSIGRAATAMGMMVAGVIVVRAIARVAHLAASGAQPGALTTAAVMNALHQHYGIGALVGVAVVLAPISEELLFRSVTLDVFARFTPLFVANGLQALLFAVAHGEPERIPYLFALGAAAGWLRQRSGGLLSSITLHALNNALAVAIMLAAPAPRVTPAGKPAQPAPAYSPSPELVACMRAVRGPLAVAPESLQRASGPSVAMLANGAAWAIAIDPAATPTCLRRAEEAVNVALRRLPEDGGCLDTKATLYYREGRFSEAVDLERGALEQRSRPRHSQLARFLRARSESGAAPIVGEGSASSVKIERAAGAGPAIDVQLGEPLADGGHLFALVTRDSRPLGLFHAAFGPDHARSYRVTPPAGLPDDARFEIALVDSRGCDGCARDHWSWEFQPRDPEADAYPEWR